MKSYKLLFLLLLFSFVACKKSSDTVTSKNEEKQLLEKILVDSKLYKEFIYDENSKLVEMNEYYNDSVFNSETYQYNENGWLEKRTYNGYVDFYEYNENGLLMSYTNSYTKANYHRKTEYQYNSSDFIQKGTLYFNGEKWGYVEYKYDYKNNTIERKEFEDQDNFLSTEIRVEFDDYKNPYPLNLPLDMIQKNNIKKSYNYSAVMSALPPEYESSFEYNSNRYPTKETRTYAVRGTKTYEYLYTSN